MANARHSNHTSTSPRKIPNIIAVLVGEAEVGKSSLFKAFTKAADFTDIAWKTLQLPSENGTKEVSIELRDTGGMERIGRSLTPNYFRGAKAIILCYSVHDRRTLAKYSERIPAQTGSITHLQHLVEKSNDCTQVQVFLCGINKPNSSTSGQFVDDECLELFKEKVKEDNKDIRMGDCFTVTVSPDVDMESVTSMFIGIAAKFRPPDLILGIDDSPLKIRKEKGSGCAC